MLRIVGRFIVARLADFYVDSSYVDSRQTNLLCCAVMRWPHQWGLPDLHLSQAVEVWGLESTIILSRAHAYEHAHMSSSRLFGDVHATHGEPQSR